MSDHKNEHKVKAEIGKSVDEVYQGHAVVSRSSHEILNSFLSPALSHMSSVSSLSPGSPTLLSSSLSPSLLPYSSPSLSPCDLFKLNIDCCEELFVWLSLNDLLALRRTCKRFRKIVDYYIKQFLPAFQLGHGKLQIHDTDFAALCRLDPISIKMIKQISFCTEKITANQIRDIKTILSSVEMIEISSWQIDGEFHSEFLQFCTNLKHLCVWNINGNKIVGSDNGWLLRRYPNLEQIELDDSDAGGAIYGREVTELKTFFELNPNIRSCTISTHFLWQKRKCLKNAKANLDLLRLYGDCDEMNSKMEQFCTFLNELFEQGFYKRLHLVDSIANANQICTLRACEMVYLEIKRLNDLVVMPPLAANIIELSFRFGFPQMEILSRNLNNVERICIASAKFADILPFIRKSAKIKTIKIYQLANGDDDHFKNNVIDVPALHKERKKLKVARKVTIYVEEPVYLATKWTISIANDSLVDIKRTEACKWTHKFY